MSFQPLTGLQAPIPSDSPKQLSEEPLTDFNEQRQQPEQSADSPRTLNPQPPSLPSLPSPAPPPNEDQLEALETPDDSRALELLPLSTLASGPADTSQSTTPAASGALTSEGQLYRDEVSLKMPIDKHADTTDAKIWPAPGGLSHQTTAPEGVLHHDDDEDGDAHPSASVSVGGSSAEEEQRQSLLVPCLAVFSSNYNFVVTSIALFIMNQDEGYRETLESVVGNGSIKMLSYAGAIAGMCVMGYLGDLIGRRLAMMLTLFLVAFGALSSAVLSWGSALSVTIVVGVFRFLLGVGSGGVYPLSSVTAAEGSTSEKMDDRCLRVSWAYSMNVPGILFPYLLALFLWWCTNKSVEISFRVLLGFGAVPAFLVWLPAWRMKDSREYVERDFAAKLFNVFVNRSYWRQLLGTGVCWLMYDVTAYGILLVQPEITQMIWGEESSVFNVIWHNIVLNAIGIPGCYMGILVLRQMGVKWLQFWGFIGLAFSALLLAATSNALRGHPWAQLSLLAVINFFINWGASITTFILPSVVFPPSVRSTYSGISAAMGKVGAVIGIYLIKGVLTNWGLAAMMVCAGFPALLAAVLTFFFVSPLPRDARSSLSQCFGSLGGCIPYMDCRRRKVA